jgi:hypothetical protein
MAFHEYEVVEIRLPQSVLACDADLLVVYVANIDRED